MTEVTTLKVAQIEESRKVKVRDQLNRAAVQEYAELYASSGSDVLPPLDIFQERNCKSWIVADGRHRLAAARKAGIEKLPCKLHEGDDIAALDFAVGCNIKHGVRRTDADLGAILTSIFNTTELAEKYRTDEELSDKVGVTVRAVQKHRARWRDEPGGNKPAKKAAQQRAGKHTTKVNGKKSAHVSTGPEKEKEPERERVHVPERTPAKAAPEREKAAARTSESKRKAIPHGDLHNIKHAYGILASCNHSPQQIADECEISKSVSDRALALVRNVAEHI